MPKSTKRATSFRLTSEARKILKRLSKIRGINRTSVLEALLREEGDRRVLH